LGLAFKNKGFPPSLCELPPMLPALARRDGAATGSWIRGRSRSDLLLSVVSSSHSPLPKALSLSKGSRGPWSCGLGRRQVSFLSKSCCSRTFLSLAESDTACPGDPEPHVMATLLRPPKSRRGLRRARREGTLRRRAFLRRSSSYGGQDRGHCMKTQKGEELSVQNRRSSFRESSCLFVAIHGLSILAPEQCVCMLGRSN
jgi:hypothetical protein